MGRSPGSASQHGFETFVRTSAPDLLRTASLLTWNQPEAEDLVQEALLRAAKRWPSIARMDHPRAYVRRIVVNLAVAEGERRGRIGMTSGRLDDEATHRHALGQGAPDLAAIDDRSELEWMLAALPRRQRAVLVLRYFEDLSEVETATALGWPIGTVKSTAARALDSLQSRFASSAPADVPSGVVTTTHPDGGSDVDQH